MRRAGHCLSLIPFMILGLAMVAIATPFALLSDDFGDDDEEEPEPLPEELRKAAESQDPS
jgi:hypothetical protein